jgi:hypothetical protein
VSNIEPKNFVVNVRRDFHKSPQLHIACYFSSKRRSSNFHTFLDRFHSASGVSYKSSAPFEASSHNSSIEANSVEHSAQLPALYAAGGKFTQERADFELKGGNLI